MWSDDYDREQDRNRHRTRGGSEQGQMRGEESDSRAQTGARPHGSGDALQGERYGDEHDSQRGWQPPSSVPQGERYRGGAADAYRGGESRFNDASRYDRSSPSESRPDTRGWSGPGSQSRGAEGQDRLYGGGPGGFRASSEGYDSSRGFNPTGHGDQPRGFGGYGGYRSGHDPHPPQPGHGGREFGREGGPIDQSQEQRSFLASQGQWGSGWAASHGQFGPGWSETRGGYGPNDPRGFVGSASGGGPDTRGETERSESRGRHEGRGPKGWKRSDERIRDDVCEQLARHPDIDASEIEVQVQDGEVILTGSVDERRVKRMAEDVAEQVYGVQEIQNQLRVARGDRGQLGMQSHREAEREISRATERDVGAGATSQEPRSGRAGRANVSPPPSTAGGSGGTAGGSSGGTTGGTP